jgi:hypothetical protein
MRRKLIFFAPLAILGMLLFLFIGGESVKLLWNWLMPQMFDLRPVTFWQAIGLLALCRILFGGFGRHASYRSSRTPEERERFRQAMRKRWGFGPPIGTPAHDCMSAGAAHRSPRAEEPGQVKEDGSGKTQ